MTTIPSTDAIRDVIAELKLFDAAGYQNGELSEMIMRANAQLQFMADDYQRLA
jgi:hypothetical protein